MLWGRRMTAPAMHCDFEMVGASQQGSGLGSDQAVGHVRDNMDGKGAVDAVEDAFFDHVFGAVVALFAGLKHEADLAGEFTLVLR